MATESPALSSDGRLIKVRDLVRHRAGGQAWRVGGVFHNETGRACLDLVDPRDAHHFTAFRAEFATIVDEES